MKYHWFWTALCLAIHSFCLLHAESQGSLISFSEPDGNRLLRIVVHNMTGDVYVGGKNVLYHLDPDLKIKNKMFTGPKLDHPACMHPTYPCVQNKSMEDDDTELLDIAYHIKTPMLLNCGTLYRGLCKVHSLVDINRWSWVGPYNESVGFTVSSGVNRAFFGRGYEEQWSLYSATTKDVGRYSPDFLSSKVLVERNDEFVFEYSFSSGKSSSAINFKERSKRSVVYGFVHGKFAYFVIMHVAQQVYGAPISKLARVCIDDGTFQSFTELPLACSHDDKVYDYALDAYVGPASKQMGTKYVAEEVLYVTFVSLDGTTVKGSTICGYTMSSVVETFTQVTKDCYNGNTNANLLQPTEGGISSCLKKDNVHITDDFCGSDINPYIIGRKPIPEKYLASLPVAITAIAIIKQRDETVAFVGTSNGFIVKMNLDKNGQLLNLNNLIEKSDQIRAPLVFDPSREYIYAHVGNKVVKFPINSCSIYETCHLCLTSGKGDPLGCGWCNGRCTQPEECNDLSSFSRYTCSPIIDKIAPVKLPVKGGTTMVIVGDNFGSFIDDEHNYVSVAGLPCRMVSWDSKAVICITSEASEGSVDKVQLNVDDTSKPLRGYIIQGSTRSSQNVSYVEPKLYGIFPSPSSMPGIMNLTFFGEHLDAGLQHSINICGRKCSEIGIRENIAWCNAGNVTSVDCRNSIEFNIDNIALEIEDRILRGITFEEFENIPNCETNHNPSDATAKQLSRSDVQNKVLEANRLKEEVDALLERKSLTFIQMSEIRRRVKSLHKIVITLAPGQN